MLVRKRPRDDSMVVVMSSDAGSATLPVPSCTSFGRLWPVPFDDRTCSRQQYNLSVSVEEGELECSVIRTGPNPTWVIRGEGAPVELAQGTPFSVRDGDKIQMTKHSGLLTLRAPSLKEKRHQPAPPTAAPAPMAARAAASVEAPPAKCHKPAVVAEGGHQWRWDDTKSLLYLDSSHASTKIAAFDIDSCLIRTKSGNTFAVDADDWTWWHECVPARVQKLHASGHKIVLFTNQNGVGKGKTTAKEVQGKFSAVIEALGVPAGSIACFAATADDLFRKPRLGAWEFMAACCNGGKRVDLRDSVYVGDAAGRPKVLPLNHATSL
jgi:bifunctional polynucleotide phosphatase/kinase